MAKPTPGLDDFESLRVLGKGSYGKVFLVRHKDSGSEKLYAMKMLRKEHVLNRNQVEHTKTERNVLEHVSHPFIVSLHYAFQTPKKLYLVLDYCPGGELFFHLSRAGRFSEGRTRFYICELLLALEYLHSLNIIFRDLKPENVLLDAEGHAKLTDFGLSKEGICDNFSARTMCGTPEYLAPELLDSKGHGRAVDWYSLGALAYEMLTGLPPYYTQDRNLLFERIRRAALSYPQYISPVAKSLLQSLLERQPEKRLGGGPHDGVEIRSHSFFSSVDWEAIYQRLVTPPFKPKVAGAADVSNFEKEFVDMPVVVSEAGAGPGVHFDGFTYQG
ncbi:unnamed protein product [Effrenium voratum]|nr:unnamed protein product [Effrenium voratum]CAJ1393420.1 unnamed protein product [Effrenium voratum]CAJ1434462.1 unnamed protein product [Effrenium voratum]